MIPETVRVALEELRGFQLTASDERGRGKEVDRLILLTSRFGRALAEVEAQDELVRRATLYEQLTGPGRPFDAARENALRLVSDHVNSLHIDDLEAAPTYERRPTKRKRDRHGNLSFVQSHTERIYPNYTPKICQQWGDHEYLRWHLPEALRDAEALLELDLPGELLKPALVAWQSALWKLGAKADTEHLFGCYLIGRCVATLDAEQSDRGRYASLASRLRADLGRYAQAAREAAEALAAAGWPARRGRPGRRGDNWWHSPDDKKPAQYKHGPLSGNQKDLARATGRSAESRPNRKAFIKFARRGVFWVIKNSGQSYDVWFKDEGRFQKAKNRLGTANQDGGA